MKNCNIFYDFCSKHRLGFLKIRKDEFPCKHQFYYYIKLRCKGVNITRTCFHDEKLSKAKHAIITIHVCITKSCFFSIHVALIGAHFMYNKLYVSGILEYSIFGFPLVSERIIVKYRLYV